MRFQQYLNEISLKQMYHNAMTAIQKKLSNSSPKYDELVAAIDDVMVDTGLWLGGEFQGMVKSYIAVKYSGAIADKFMNTYEKKGKRRLQDR